VKSWLSLLLVVLLPVAAVAESEKSDKDSKKSKATPTPASTEQKEDAMLRDLPQGQTYTGLRIPNFSPTGKLLMLLDAKEAKRVGDRDVDLTELKLEIHNEDGTTFHVTTAHSVFNLDTRILASDTPTKITREDFVITGEKADFYLKTKFGRMKGSTKMIINSEQVK
jgi:hypothetical protein